MERWQQFLNSLSTKGGNILVLLFVCVILGFALLHVLHHAEMNAEARALVLSSFSGAFAALMFALQAGGGQRKADNGNGNSANGNPVQK